MHHHKCHRRFAENTSVLPQRIAPSVRQVRKHGQKRMCRHKSHRSFAGNPHLLAQLIPIPMGMTAKMDFPIFPANRTTRLHRFVIGARRAVASFPVPKTAKNTFLNARGAEVLSIC